MEQMQTFNPGTGLQTQSGHKIKELSLDEYTELMHAAIEVGYNKGTSSSMYLMDRDRLLMRVLFEVGLRIASALDLVVDSTDKTLGTIEFRQDKKRDKRKMFVRSASSELLDEYAQFTIRHKDRIGRDHRLFPITRLTFQKRLNKYTAYAGIRHVSPHAFRHGCAMNLLDKGTNMHVIGYRLGHSSVAVTESSYAVMTPVIEAKLMRMAEIQHDEYTRQQ